MGLFGRKKKPDDELNDSTLYQFLGDYADLYTKKKYDECLKLGESFYEQYPNNLDVIKNICEINLKKENYEKCKILLNKGLEQYPGNSYLIYYLSIVFYELDDVKMASNILREGLKTIYWDADCTEQRYKNFLTTLENIMTVSDENYEGDETITDIRITQIDQAIDENHTQTLWLMEKKKEYLNKKTWAIASQSDIEIEGWEDLEMDVDEELKQIRNERIVLQKERQKIIDENNSKEQDIHNSQKNPIPNLNDDPVVLLKLRLAKGEITKEEFQDLKSTLEDD